MAKYFKASSWDLLVQLITVGVISLALLFIYFNPNLISFLALGSLVFIPPFYMIKGYSIKDQKLIIHRLGWQKEFDIRDLKNVEFKAQALKGSLRLLGNGGLFGWIGTFSNKGLGTFKAYATNRHKCVVLELESRKLVITPRSPEDFVEYIQPLLKRDTKN